MLLLERSVEPLLSTFEATVLITEVYRTKNFMQDMKQKFIRCGFDTRLCFRVNDCVTEFLSVDKTPGRCEGMVL